MNEPIAYAAVAADGSESVYVASLKEQAEACCRENGWQLVPLYAAVQESWQLVHENERLRDEIELLRGYRDEAEADAAVARLLVDRSRLTDDEQAALQRAIDALYAREDLSPTATADDAMAAARLARLRDRLKAIKTPRDDRLKAVENLRLTDAEREAVEFALDRLRGTLRGNRECDHADTLRGLLERHGTGDTLPPHATPPQGSVQGERSVPDSRTGNDPAAWAVTMGDGSVYEAFAAHQYDEAVALARKCLFGSDLPLPLEPLYRQPTLTDVARESLAAMACYFDSRSDLQMQAWGSLLRGLLERAK